MYMYRILVKETLLQNISHPPTLGSISCYGLKVQCHVYSNMHPYVAALEYVAIRQGIFDLTFIIVLINQPFNLWFQHCTIKYQPESWPPLLSIGTCNCAWIRLKINSSLAYYSNNEDCVHVCICLGAISCLTATSNFGPSPSLGPLPMGSFSWRYSTCTCTCIYIFGIIHVVQ